MDEPTRPSVDGSAFVTASMDGTGLLEGDAFVVANEKLAECFGFDDPEDLVGVPWTELYPRAERERIERRVLPKVRNGHRWRGEVLGLRTDGETCRHTLSITRAGDGRLAWVVRDRSEGPESGPDPVGGEDPPPGGTEDAIRTREPEHGRDTARDREPAGVPVEPQEVGSPGVRVSSLVETAPVPIVVFTDDRGIVYSNRKAVEVLGADDRADVLGSDPERFVHPEHRDRARERIRRVVEKGDVTEPASYRLVGLNDRERFVEMATAPVTFEGEPGALVVINDITSYRRSQVRLRRERRFLQTVIDAIDDVFYVIDEEGESYRWNQTLVETTGYSHREIEEMRPRQFLPEDHHEYVPGLMEAIDSIDDRRVTVDVLTKDGERIPHEFRGTTVEDPETGEVYRCGIARDIAERERRKRELKRRLEELATLDRINEILLETTRDLVRTADREVIERTVCTRLAESNLYERAWIGERRFDSDRIVPRAAAGGDSGALDAVATELNDDEHELIIRAMRTGDVQIAGGDRQAVESRPEETGEDGPESIAAVPLHHDEAVYGVLLVHTARENAFSDREQSGFDVLGRTVGFVINAVKNHELLFTDTVVELEFRVSDVDSAFVRTAVELDCELEISGYVDSESGWVLYVRVTGVPPTEAVAELSDHPGVERARALGATDDAGRLEVVVTAPSLVHAVTSAGASVSTATAGPDGTRLVVEAPVGADVRELVDHVRGEYPAAELVAQRDRDRTVTTASRPDGVLGELTDRQRDVLEAAYRSGYFAWPRESTAEEVAESLDLASATLHGHLRKAEEAIFASLFDDE